MPVSRRALILSGVAAGGGLAVVWAGRALDDGDARAKFAASTPSAAGLNAWIKIEPDGTTILGVHRAEMGQGVTTALPMLLAEELDADWSRVRWEFTPLDRDYFNFGMLLRGRPLGEIEGRPLAALGTGLIRRVFHVMGMSMTISSTSVVDAWDSLRPAGAAARQMLLDAAARQWGVAADTLHTEPGRVVDPAAGRSLGYGELAAAAARLRPPARPRLKDPADWRLVGRSLPRLDIPDQVSGSARFGIDTRQPGMLYGTVRHLDRLGGRIARIDAEEMEARWPSAQLVRIDERSVAVLAGDTWTAMQAAAGLVLEPAADAPAITDSTALFDEYRAALDGEAVSVFVDEGGAASTWEAAGRRLEAEYRLPWLAHLCMEPMNCAARYADGRLELWAPTQANTIARDVAARFTGLDPAAIEVHSTLMGGGFGRRAEMDFIAQAAVTALAVPGRAINLAWTREQDVRHDMYRPAALGRVRAALDADGRIAALDYVLASASVVASYYQRTPTARGGDASKDRSALSGALDQPYAIPAVRMRYAPQDTAVPAGFWRSVGNSINPFLVESAMDELAQLAGADPLEFRLRHLADRPEYRRVLELAATRAGWGAALPAGHGRGLALIESHDSIVAQVIEVAVDERGLRVLRITCAVDCRTVIHPDSVVAQIEGGALQALGAALHGRITTRDGVVEQRNFDDCRVLRLADTPEIQVHLLPQGGRPGGVGEPGLPGIAPALANAVFAATGRRIRELPLAGQFPG